MASPQRPKARVAFRTSVLLAGTISDTIYLEHLTSKIRPKQPAPS
jgi:hypothetical protein